MTGKAKITKISGSLVEIRLSSGISTMNELAYIHWQDKKLKAEVIRIRNDTAELQVFEDLQGLTVGSLVELTGQLLSCEVGPGLLSQIYDGLQNSLVELSEKNVFLDKGVYFSPLDRQKIWQFTALCKIGDTVSAGHYLGSVPEQHFQHKIMVPFYLVDDYIVSKIYEGKKNIDDCVVELKDKSGKTIPITMSFMWPIKKAINAYQEKLIPKDPMLTQIRIIDSFLPIAKGGTFCVPGPFGAGKTVLQQSISRNADVDIVVIVACGERAGEVVETLSEFPSLIDPKTGGKLMERTIVICNTSAMPVASRESSVYLGMTIAEYYRQMGLDILILADSTSRWAQALREISGRLEEIPGEEAYPAYLESTLVSFYERAGLVRLFNQKVGSITMGGNVSPAGGNFEEPVTQATLKVVGAFLGLNSARSEARKYPAINILDSWSQYSGFLSSLDVNKLFAILRKGNNIYQMMKVVGEESIIMNDYITYLKSELIDSVYLQQNSFDTVDCAVSQERQTYFFNLLLLAINKEFEFSSKLEAQNYFAQLRQIFIDTNSLAWETERLQLLCQQLEQSINEGASL